MKLQTKLSFLLAILLFCNYLYSQPRFRYGLTAGGNICRFTGVDKPKSQTPGFGYFGGISLETRTSEYTSMWFQPSFIQRSSEFTEAIYSFGNSSLTVNERFSYLSVPVYFKLRKEGRYSSAYIKTGGEISYMLLHKQSGAAFIDNLEVNRESYYNYAENEYDYGVGAKIGGQIDAIFFEIGYYLSLRNIYKGEDYREIRFEGINAGIGYEINYPRPINKVHHGAKFSVRFKYHLKRFLNRF